MTVLIYFIVLLFSGTTFSQEKTYVLTAPKIFRAGASEKVVVQAFGYEKEFPVNIALKSFPDKLVVYSSGRISLTPANKFQDAVTLTDPEGVEVDIMEEKDFTGIVSFPDFKIPPNPKYGIWKIKAKYKKDFVTSAVAKFEVKEYAMPSFSIVIEPESNFISSDKFENFRIVVKARSSFIKIISALLEN
ncbi:hypothetical protein DUI87_30018 [Hirundo rustica rustica]|uniref:Complement C3/4/5 macroglobulin domain-containing protein n=1 Tax=Hirundo rustica rustica TaxID=333673 RepID=A0A3M0IWX2_HIRRU|nr:hypothetical protein DUI87_30018 [Hirundo rustica rustica]